MATQPSASAPRSTSGFSSSSSGSSVEEDFEDARSAQSPQHARSPRLPVEPVAPHHQKFSRYRSMRKARAAEPGDSQQAGQNPQNATGQTNVSIKKSMSRYKRTRPLQPPHPLASTELHESEESATTTTRRNDSQAEAYDSRNAEKVTNGAGSKWISGNETRSTTYPDRMKKPLEDRRDHPQSNPRPVRGSQSPVQSPSAMSSPEQLGHDVRPGTAKSSGADSWASSLVDMKNPSRSLSTASDRQARRPSTAGSQQAPQPTNVPNVASNPSERKIVVRINNTAVELSIGRAATAENVLIAAAAMLPNTFDPSTAILAESLPKLGLERPIRRYEQIYPILNSWDYETQHQLLVLTPEETGSSEDSASRGARGLDLASAPSIQPIGHRLQLQHANKPGRWTERIAILKPDGQVALATRANAPPAEWTRIGHMTDFDAYIVKEKRRRNLGTARGARHIVAIKSLQRAALFEVKADYVHFFSSHDQPALREWWEALRAWRSWHLVHQMSLGGLSAPVMSDLERLQIETTGRGSRDMKRAGTLRATPGPLISGNNNSGSGDAAAHGPSIAAMRDPSNITRSHTSATATKPRPPRGAQAAPSPLVTFPSTPISHSHCHSHDHNHNRSPRSPRSPHSPAPHAHLGGTSQVPPLSPTRSKTPRSSSDHDYDHNHGRAPLRVPGGLVAHAHNVDPSIGVEVAAAPSATTTMTSPPRRLRGREGQPLVDLTTQSPFAPGSLLARVQRRENEVVQQEQEELQRRRERMAREAGRVRR